MAHHVLAAVHVAAGGLLVATFLWALRGVTRRSARIYIVMLLTDIAWGVWTGLSLLLSPADLAWAVPIRDVLGFAVVWLWLVFVIHFTGHEAELSRPEWGLLGAYLAVVSAVVLTDPLHGLAYAGFVEGIHGVPHPQYGPAFWGVFLSMHVLYVVSLGLLLQRFFTTAYMDARGSIATALMLFLPFSVDFLNTLVVEPWVGFELTPGWTMLIGTGVTYAFAKYDLFSVEPVSRNAVLDSTDDAIVVLRDGRVIDYNAAAESTFVTDPNPLGKPAREVLHEEVRSLLPETHADTGILTDGAMDAGEVTVDIEGRKRHFDPRVSSSAGPGDATVLALREVTALKRKERELSRENERLEKFTGTVAHDLRNPINIAHMYVSMIGEREEAADRIESAVERMDAMVDDLLELARQGKTVGETESVDLAAAAEDAWAAVETGAATCRIETDRRVETDPDRLANLLENLFRNAIDHVGEDVTVTVGDRPDGFYVADDGPGIPEEEREQVFEHGFTTRDEGTGFGLSIVGEIAAAHGWEIEATESADGGARFDVRTDR